MDRRNFIKFTGGLIGVGAFAPHLALGDSLLTPTIPTENPFTSPSLEQPIRYFLQTQERIEQMRVAVKWVSVGRLDAWRKGRGMAVSSPLASSFPSKYEIAYKFCVRSPHHPLWKDRTSELVTELRNCFREGYDFIREGEGEVKQTRRLTPRYLEVDLTLGDDWIDGHFRQAYA